MRIAVVWLSCEERGRLEALTHVGKSPAQLLTKARILLKADVSEAGEGWSDSAISAALDTSINNIGRLRRRLVEEGLDGSLKRKYNPNSARPRIFDGVAEAKLIALTCSPAPEGFARWSLRLLEDDGQFVRSSSASPHCVSISSPRLSAIPTVSPSSLSA